MTTCRRWRAPSAAYPDSTPEPVVPHWLRGLASGGLILALAGCAGPTTSVSPGSASPAPPASPVSSPSTQATPTGSGEPVSIESVGATHIDLTGQPDWVAVAAGSAWVAVVGGVRKVDGASGKVDGLVPIDDVVCLAMDVGFDSVWAGGCGKHILARIEPKTGLLF